MGEPLVVVAVAVGERDGAVDIDRCRETVDADTSDPAAEHDEQVELAERGDTAAVSAGVTVEAAAVGAVDVSSLERAAPTHL